MERLPTTVSGFIGHFVKQRLGWFVLIQFFWLGWALDNTVWPWMLKLLIDKLMAFTGDKGDIWIYLSSVLIGMACLWLLIEVMFRTAGILASRVVPKFEASMRLAMFDYVQRHSYTFFANHFAGNISNKISDMISSSTLILQTLITVFVPSFVALIIATSLFATVSPLFAGLLLGWVMLHMGICIYCAPKCCQLSNIHSTSRSTLTGQIVDSFTNVVNIKLFARQRYELNHLSTYQDDERKQQQVSQFYVEQVRIYLGISAFLIPGVLNIWLMVYSWQQGAITIAELVFIFNTTGNIMLLAWISGLELPNFFKEIGTCQQALTLIQAEHDIVDAEDATILTVRHGEIAFDDVTFFYNRNANVFEHTTITLEAGKKTGLVGFSGSGKTTFVNLIMRFFDIESGRILIDGQDISQITCESLREQISMIPQDPTLFHRSLMENIRYGRIDATDEEVIQAAEQAHCHTFISQLTDGYDSLVGERGIKLSGGQRQRIAIARALLKNAPILILDEATSALDSATEKEVQDGLNTLMADRTTIVIAHRLSTLSEMDRILVFDQGHIVEDGNHDSLLAFNGHYAKLWALQAGGFLPEKDCVT